MSHVFKQVLMAMLTVPSTDQPRN